MNRDEFFQNLDPENITPEQAAQMLELEGDTGNAPETGSDAPSAPAVAEGGDSGAQDNAGQGSNEGGDGNANNPDASGGTGGDKDAGGDAGNGDAETPVLLAKDGVHTIPYDKLVEAREAEKRWKAEAEAAKAELERLQSQAQEESDSNEELSTHERNEAIAQDAIDNGIDPDLFGDWSEEDLAKGVMKLVELKLQEERQRMTQQQSQEEASRAHYQAIYDAHPDADSIIESKELAEWIESQPSHVKIGVQNVLQSGSAQQVIEVFNDFKAATGKTQAGSDDVKAKARQAASAVTSEPPASLSDIPGGKAAGASLEEQLANLDGTDLLDRMQDMTPDQIDSVLNRLI